MTTSSTRTVTLVSLDDQAFDLSVGACKLSNLVRNSIGLDEDCTTEDDLPEGELKVEIMRVSGQCLEKIVAFLEHHHVEEMGEIAMPLAGPTFEDVSSAGSFSSLVFVPPPKACFSQTISFPWLFLFLFLRPPQCMPLEWYRTFVQNVPREMLFELLTASNYMDIKPLLDLACLRVTFELSARSAEEVSKAGGTWPRPRGRMILDSLPPPPCCLTDS
jgi:S-phase kinase-associated protein 1